MKRNVGAVTWSHGRFHRTTPVGNTMPEKQRDWKLKQKEENKFSHSAPYSPSDSVQLSHPDLQSLLFFVTPVQQLEANGRQTHRNKLKQDNMTGIRQAVSSHTCVLQVEASSGYADVRLEGQVQIVGCAVQQLGNCCTWITQHAESNLQYVRSISKIQAPERAEELDNTWAYTSA